VKAPFTPSGEPTPEFLSLLHKGRQRSYLTPDDLMAVLEGVELRPELISAVTGRVAAEGIEWRDQGELLSDEGLDKLAAELVGERPGKGRPSPAQARQMTAALRARATPLWQRASHGLPVRERGKSHPQLGDNKRYKSRAYWWHLYASA